MVNSEAAPERVFSPNQREKRTQIIEAARSVLVEVGLEGCTVRGVAAASPLTKSAIHYYFHDMDELIDQAMAAHVSAFVEALRTAVAGHASPAERFSAAVEAYLALFHGQPRAMVLWHEYWLHCLRRDRLTKIEEMLEEVTGIFRELLTELGFQDAPTRSRILVSYLMGAATRLVGVDSPAAAVHAEIGLICPVS